MKFSFFITCILAAIQASAQPGFNSVTGLSPLPVAFTTGDDTQSKLWTYAGKQWAVFATTAGTNIYRLDGTAWTSVLTLASGSTARADIKVVGNVTHIFTWKGAASYLYSVQYDAATDKYKLWTVRNTRVAITLSTSATTGTIDIDGTGRMWLASNANKIMQVQWSDYPYSTWSSAIQLVTGAASTDLCSVIAIPALSKVGVFWSSKTTKRFGFRTHTDGDDPATWAADESPASQSALNMNGGFADGQFNLKTLANGTVFAAVKTSYSQVGYPQLELLLRRPDGSWDAAYPVTTNEGTNPVVAVNEAIGKLKVIYTLPGTGIVYKESPTSAISFSNAIDLISGDYDNTTTTKENYVSQAVVIASNATVAAGIVGTDPSTLPPDQTPPAVTNINRLSPLAQTTNATTVTYRVIFSEAVTNVDAADFAITATGNVNAVIAANAVTPVAGSNATAFDVAVSSVTGNGSLRLDLKNTGTQITDAAGNMITTGFTGGQLYTIQQTPPTLVSVSFRSDNAAATLAKAGNTVTLAFTASEAINTPVVTIATHSVAVIPAGAANAYSASYVMTGTDVQGNIPFTINFNTSVGTQGAETISTTDGSAVSFDRTAPQVLGVNRQSPLTETTNALSVTYRVTFSEAVTGVDAADFSLVTTSGTAAGAIQSNAVTPQGSTGSVYDVVVSSVTGNGSLRLDVKATATGIRDAASNDISGGFNTGEQYSVSPGSSTGTPVLVSVSLASGNSIVSLAKPGDIITLRFTSSEPVNTPVVTIAGHTVSAVAGSGNSFAASYTVTTADAEGNIPFTIDYRNLSGVAGTQVTATTNGSFVSYDKTVPAIVSVLRQLPAEQNTSASEITFRATFSEPVTGVDATDFTLANTSGAATGTLASNAVVMVGTDGAVYDIRATSVSGNGVLRLDVNAANTGIADAAGNAIASGFNSGETYTIMPVVIPGGFVSVTPLQPVDLSQPTKDKPQAKVWNYANKWWCVLSVAAGTKLFRLDGTTWTDILLLNNKTSKPDCRISGDMVHVLCYKGALNNSMLYSLKYDPTTISYRLWTVRPTGTNLVFPAGSETATIVVDGTGRMWAASDGETDMSVWYSDPPYTGWSAPVTIASGTKTDDICAITYIPALNKIGVFWSNQVTKLFGFRTHADGTDPASWSNDEMPASQSAIAAGNGMADDHMNLKAGSDGTVYCAAKTSYNKTGYAKLILLVRRPNGVWDNQYIVTMNPEGTQPIVMLNEAKGKLRVIYASLENGGDILYRESDISNIAFGPARTLVSNPGFLYDYTTSTHQNCNTEAVMLVTDLTSVPQKAVGLILSDENMPGMDRSVTADIQPFNAGSADGALKAYPNPFTTGTNISFSVASGGEYILTLYDSKGIRQFSRQGWAVAGINNTVTIDGSLLRAGVYFAAIRTGKENRLIRLLVTH